MSEWDRTLHVSRDKVYRNARLFHVWLLRREGLTWKAIGERMGVTGTRVRGLWHKRQRMAKHPLNEALREEERWAQEVRR